MCLWGYFISTFTVFLLLLIWIFLFHFFLQNILQGLGIRKGTSDRKLNSPQQKFFFHHWGLNNMIVFIRENGAKKNRNYTSGSQWMVDGALCTGNNYSFIFQSSNYSTLKTIKPSRKFTQLLAHWKNVYLMNWSASQHWHYLNAVKNKLLWLHAHELG